MDIPEAKLTELRLMVWPALAALRPAWAAIEQLLPDPVHRWFVLLMCLRRVERSALLQGLPADLMREALIRIIDQAEADGAD